MAGRPKGSNKKNNKVNEPKPKRKCNNCKKEKTITNFYQSSSIMFDGYAPLCKTCIKEMVNYDDINTVYGVLQALDMPFVQYIWDSCEDRKQEKELQGKIYDLIGNYIRQINSLPNYKGMGWKNSEFQEDIDKRKQEKVDKRNKENNINAQVTREMYDRWGENYTKKQLIDLEKFYNDMKMTHTIVTPQHVKALIMLCKMQLKLDIFLENDDMASFSKLHEQYQKLLTSSGLRPIDKVGGDEATGMRSFSHIFEEVEKNGFIEPRQIEERQDIVDRTIMYILNYTKKIVGQQSLDEPPEDTPKVGVNIE